MKKKIQKNAGFTLIEVLIAITLLVILLAGIVKVMTACLRASRVCEYKIEAQQTARFAVDSMVRELKYAKKITIINSKGLMLESDVTGESESIYYGLDADHVIRRITEREIIPQPLTSAIISRLEFTPQSGQVNTVFILLTAETIDDSVNSPERYEYTIETAVSKLNI
jgi:prepilin-type N-terminal cleavage/methylation domain-containing protein